MVYHRVLSDIHGAITGSLVGNASTATVLETARKIGGVLFDGSQDIELPGVNAQGNQNTTGNAATATKLQTARRIGGVSFDGSADIDLPGVNAAGNQNTSGNAATATKLQTARKIGGVSFDGSADINLPGVNAAGNQSTTGNAGTATKLQTPRTINSVSFDGSANISIPTLVSRGRMTALAVRASYLLAGVGQMALMRRFIFVLAVIQWERTGLVGRRSTQLLINPQRKMLGPRKRLARLTAQRLAIGLPLNLSHG